MNAPSHPGGAFMGSTTSIVLLTFSFVPEVPPAAQWICLLLSATASTLTIIKLNKK
jgi:hypothetical protein